MGKWKALEVIDTTIEQTKALLFPIRRSLWLKLALVVIVMGGFSGGGVGNYNMGGPADYYSGETGMSQEGELGELSVQMEVFLTEYGVYLIIGVFLLVLISIVFMYVGDVLQFVFLRGVLEGKVEIMDWSLDNLGKGLSLFLFKIVIGIAIMVLLGIASIPFIGGMATGSVPLILVGTVLGGILFILIMILASVVYLAAADFVVPVMHFKDKGIWAGYKDVFALVKADPWQFVLYVIIRMVLSIAGGIISLLLMIPLMIFWFIILAVVGVLAWAFSQGVGLTPDTLGLIGWTLVVFIILVLVIGFIYSISLLTLPVPVYMRLYSLLFIMTQDESIEGPRSSMG